jgi:hypothetical protein
MTARFNHGTGNWTDYRRQFPGIHEVDFHYGSQRHLPWHERVPFERLMERAYADALAALQAAQAAGKDWLMLTHGASTSGPGQKSARSVIRGLMRSAAATPYIVRSECIQHETVFIARIKARPEVKV